MPILALLTDFGQRDWYLAAMKAVALRHCPDARLIDITHDIEPGDIAEAAFVLSQCWEEFPPGTVFLAVVDPGVGTARPAVALEAARQRFVGPDNGLFGWLGERADHVRRLENPALCSAEAAPTFHGRDVFAPVAAGLAAGTLALDEVGPAHDTLLASPWPEPDYAEKSAHGRVLYIDRFGNAITNLRGDELERRLGLAHCEVSLHPRHVPLVRTFGDVPAGHPLAYIGSGGLLEIGVNGGHAAQLLDLRPGLHVEVVLSRKSR